MGQKVVNCALKVLMRNCKELKIAAFVLLDNIIRKKGSQTVFNAQKVKINNNFKGTFSKENASKCEQCLPGTYMPNLGA